MPRKASKKIKKRIEIEENQIGAGKLQAENLLKEQIEDPMVQLRYAYAIDVIQARLKLVNADLTEQNHRQIIRSMSSRIKSTESICKKLVKKEREVTFENAVTTLNDIAGIRVVCYFCDDIYQNAGQILNVERETRDYSDVIAKVDNKMLELRRRIERM